VVAGMDSITITIPLVAVVVVVEPSRLHQLLFLVLK